MSFFLAVFLKVLDIYNLMILFLLSPGISDFFFISDVEN